MERSSKNGYLFVVLSALFTSSAHAAVVVYTDRVAWETAVLALPSGHIHGDVNFEGDPPRGLSTGANALNLHFLTIDIAGDPGFNAIDNSVTPDPFSDVLSPNGSTYYLGHVGQSAPLPSLIFIDLENSVPAFAADWVVAGSLSIQIGGTTVSFADHLPTGNGFLGLCYRSDASRGCINCKLV